MYELARHGEFFAVPKGCTHCGLDKSRVRFKYWYCIRSHPDGLNSSGFVVDNLEPQRWFDGLGEFEESCELLARRAAEKFASWCLNPHSVTVTITAFEQATVSYTFDCSKERLRMTAD